MAESEGIEPLGFLTHPGFRDRLPTVQRHSPLAERPGVEPGEVYNPSGLANRLRTTRTPPYGNDEGLLEQGIYGLYHGHVNYHGRVKVWRSVRLSSVGAATSRL